MHKTLRSGHFKYYSTRMYSARWRYWSKTEICISSMPRWGDGIDLGLKSIDLACPGEVMVLIQDFCFKYWNGHSLEFCGPIVEKKSKVYNYILRCIYILNLPRWGDGIDQELKLWFTRAQVRWWYWSRIFVSNSKMAIASEFCGPILNKDKRCTTRYLDASTL